MQEKAESTGNSLFNLLADELTNIIRLNLEPHPQAHDSFAFTCRHFYQLSKPERLRVRLAQYVTEGTQSKVKEMLEKYPQLLLKRGLIKDKSGRVFENITVWEYILWALDVKYMGPMILNCLSQHEEGKRIAVELLSQFDGLEKNGIRYVLNGEEYNEKHYDFAIINALQTFVKYFNQWDWHTKLKHWKQIIGMAEFYLPAHVAQHYCDPEVPFEPTPEFNSETFNRVLSYFNNLTKKVEPWWPDAKLAGNIMGVDFAIMRSGTVNGSRGVNHMRGADIAAQKDMQALNVLRTIRSTTDLPALKKKLVDMIQASEIQSAFICSNVG
ncbi:hypothetical protein [Legionella drancourtii]|uniref:Uncharacterized protein n=1 Tax=Legionella drancourtii LLAP12 TaxID=658187 RepID=G9EMG6_9GAMM|nr:hypothetical protein [Legionella drancourtii]EHL31502.1 hypothetical protein LDG_6433 [Legionella drancourtii LLAP12]